MLPLSTPMIGVLFALGLTSGTLGTRSDVQQPCAEQKPTTQTLLRISKPVVLDDSTVSVEICLFQPRGTPPVASYHLKLFYDSAGSSVVSSDRPSGGMRVDNTAIPGVVAVAGASANGFSNGLVAAVVFRTRSRRIPSLRLSVIELHSIHSRSVSAVIQNYGHQRVPRRTSPSPK